MNSEQRLVLLFPRRVQLGLRVPNCGVPGRDRAAERIARARQAVPRVIKALLKAVTVERVLFIGFARSNNHPRIEIDDAVDDGFRPPGGWIVRRGAARKATLHAIDSNRLDEQLFQVHAPCRQQVIRRCHHFSIGQCNAKPSREGVPILLFLFLKVILRRLDFLPVFLIKV